LKAFIFKIGIFLFLIHSNFAFSQEWKNFKLYQKATNNIVLSEGCWLKRDRIKLTTIWKQANKFNLNQINGYEKYRTISEIRDFYFWFDQERILKGHEINWIGVAAIATNQLSKLDNEFIRTFIVRNKEVVKFANEGSQNVFKFSFPKLKQVYFSIHSLKGIEAKNWDSIHGTNEQCLILEPLYKKLSEKTFNKLERMARGKGIYYFGTPKGLKYEGRLDDCDSRVQFGFNNILPLYLTKMGLDLD